MTEIESQSEFEIFAKWYNRFLKHPLEGIPSAWTVF